MAYLGLQDYKNRRREARNRAQSKREGRFDKTVVGTIKIFLNGFRIEFCKSGSYYLFDEYHNSAHFCSYSKRERMFDFINLLDFKINFASTEEMGQILYAFTNKINCWIKLN